MAVFRRVPVSRFILVVDDDAALLKMVKTSLERRQYRVITAQDGAAALSMISEHKPDLVLSDAEMPVLDGHALARVLRQEAGGRHTPLILMSGARVEEQNVLAGFESGADDYVMKPFSVPVLVARIEAVMRRYESAADAGGTLRRQGLELDPEARTAKVKGQKVALTRKEFDLLAQLVGRTGKVVSVPHLLQTVWGYDPDDDIDSATVETHVSSLRRKLGKDLAAHVVNVPGHGYKFEDDVAG
jgi:DNA-binding response OmpR family regulator